MKKYLTLSTSILISLLLVSCGEISDDNLAGPRDANNQQYIDQFAQTLDVKYQLISNVPDEQCAPERMDGNCFQVQLHLTPTQDFLSNDWAIYYSQINPVQSVASADFIIEHINGDLHKISPTSEFKGFTAGVTYTLPYRVDFWSLSETDALPNYIFAVDGKKAQVISSTETIVEAGTGLEIAPFVNNYSSVTKHFKRSKTDKTEWATANVLYERNAKKLAANNDLSNSLIPTPKSIDVTQSASKLDLSTGINISAKGIETNAIASALSRLESFGIKQQSSGVAVTLSIDSSNNTPSSYQLNVDASGINIKGGDQAGVFYGLQSIAALLSLDNLKLPYLTISDEPHYEFRGMMVDVARNFHSKQFLLDLMEQMSALKMNKLHLHLGDDEGWRLEIKDLPQLTELSSKRCFDLTETRCLLPQLGAGIDENSKVNGFYSISDYKEILQYASARHIQVIPSLDMPGHSRSSIVAMKSRYNTFMKQGNEAAAKQYLLHDENDKTVYSSVQYYNDNTINACMESSYDFIGKVMDEVKAMHAGAGQPLTRYHIGADETAGAWVESPVCKEFIANNEYGITKADQLGGYFIERVAKILSDRDIETAGWSDGLSHTNKDNMPSVVQVNSWGVLSWQGHQAAHKLANQNWQIVASNPDVTYFDFPYEADPKEHGYYWATRHSNSEKLFQFMPDNLPAHAEFWLDREELPYESNDSVQLSAQGDIESGPLAVGTKFVGIQGQLWSENTRSDNLAEYKIFPRLFSLAERAWHKPNWAVEYNSSGQVYNQTTENFTAEMQDKRNQQWSDFANTIANKELPKLDLADVFYRIPTVGAKIQAGKLYMNSAYLGLPLEYRTTLGEWQKWSKPVGVSGEIEVRSRSKDLHRAGRSLFLKE
ncbi:family 20 glycosylhydrolase [Colwelliaceae bacterium BS250]